MKDPTFSTLAALAGYVPPTEWRTPNLDFPDFYRYAPYVESNDPYGFVEECNYAHLDEIAIACKMFANESTGEVYPPLSTEAGKLMFTQESLYPEYLTNPGTTLCPGQPTTASPPYFDDRDYVYFGYVMLNDSDVATFVSAYSAQLAGGGDFSADLPVTTSYGETMYRLREGVEDLFTYNPAAAVAAQSSIPLMMEWPDNHEGFSGGWVLYMDGHEEWINYPGEFPMTTATVNALGALAGRVPKTDWADPCPAYTLENDPYGLCAECREQCLDLWSPLRGFAYYNTGEFFPILSNEPGRLMFTEDEIACNYVADSEKLICPGPAELTPQPYFDDQHYVYLGYLVSCDEDVAGFATAYAAQMAGTRDFSGDLPGVVSYGTTIYRLRHDYCYYGLVTDTADPANGYIGPHAIPVLIEWPDNHEGLSGGHVLFMDGHVEWIPYPGKFPMTEATIGTLDSIATWPRTTAWATREFTQHNDPHKQALCAYNMFCLSVTIRAFGNHAKHENYPALSTTPGQLMFATDDVYPHFLHDITRLNCPGSACAFEPPVLDDQSYVYLGYLLLNETDLQAFATAYAAQLAGGGDFSGDLAVTTSYGDTLYRLREGLKSGFDSRPIIDPTLIPNLPDPSCVGTHTVPLLFEWPDNHGAIRGGNALYMDGHVEWLDYPSEFPMTESAMTILTTLAGRPPIE